MSLYLGGNEIDKVYIKNSINLQTKTADPSLQVQQILPDNTYDGLSSVQINPVILQDKTVSPTTSQQTVSYDSGYNGLSSVTVGGYTAGITKLIRNDTSIVPTGRYATSSYYNTTYGVKIGYMSTGDILFSMQGGTTSSYEKLNFVSATVPSGVTLNSINVAASYTGGQPGLMYACIISGVTSLATLTVAMDYRSSTYNYTRVSISIAY